MCISDGDMRIFAIRQKRRRLITADVYNEQLLSKRKKLSYDRGHVSDEDMLEHVDTNHTFRSLFLE